MSHRRNQPAVRDAATMILLRGQGSQMTVLLGRRPRSARFMPSVYVFPGGGLEPEDHQPSGLPENFGPPRGDPQTRALWRPLLRCALRELLEETGLLLTREAGLTLPATTGVRDWACYRNHAAAPAFHRLRLVHRDITPPSSPIRFDARFFCDWDPDPKQTRRQAPPERFAGNGELEDLAWYPLAALDALALKAVTRRALRQALGPLSRAAAGPG